MQKLCETLPVLFEHLDSAVLTRLTEETKLSASSLPCHKLYILQVQSVIQESFYCLDPPRMGGVIKGLFVIDSPKK